MDRWKLKKLNLSFVKVKDKPKASYKFLELTMNARTYSFHLAWHSSNLMRHNLIALHRKSCHLFFLKKYNYHSIWKSPLCFVLRPFGAKTAISIMREKTQTKPFIGEKAKIPPSTLLARKRTKNCTIFFKHRASGKERQNQFHNRKSAKTNHSWKRCIYQPISLQFSTQLFHYPRNLLIALLHYHN